MDCRKFKNTIAQMKKHTAALNAAGYHCAFVYATSTGLLTTHGSSQLTGRINTAVVDLLNMSELGIGAAEQNNRIAIPLLGRPLRAMSVMDLRKVIPQLMRGPMNCCEWHAYTCI